MHCCNAPNVPYCFNRTYALKQKEITRDSRRHFAENYIARYNYTKTVIFNMMNGKQMHNSQEAVNCENTHSLFWLKNLHQVTSTVQHIQSKIVPLNKRRYLSSSIRPSAMRQSLLSWEYERPLYICYLH